MNAPPDVSVVVATRDRRERLEALLAGLREQTLAPERFEVVIVDDGSRDGTWALLEQQRRRSGLELRALHRERSGGPSVARNLGWREARAETIAFTDDDCVPDPGWLEAGLSACAENPGAIVQGPTIPSLEEWERLPALARPFTHAMEVRGPDPHMQTCNVFYPRQLLERHGGFDTGEFARNMAEDADLAWRAIESGADTAFAPNARVTHAINLLGPVGKLRRAASWDLVVYARHPGLRDAWFRRRIFWLGSHYFLSRAIVATLLPRRSGRFGPGSPTPTPSTCWSAVAMTEAGWPSRHGSRCTIWSSSRRRSAARFAIACRCSETTGAVRPRRSVRAGARPAASDPARTR